MNPFMMSNIFFGPMGMSVSPMCCSGINMPYYGQNDMLTFMNFPIFRNPGNDYLLDPRLAIFQSQQSMMTGGSIFGNNFLPLFNNFPGMNFPWMQPKTETEEEKKAREAKETEAKKPEAKKAASLKKEFDNIKKLAETKNLITLDESVVKKAEEAMKKEKAEDQLSGMKEVMALIPEDIIRKAVMADETVVKKLKEAGYNFNYKNNKYSLPDSGIENVKMNQVHDNIISKHNYDAKGLGSFGAAANPDTILALVSAWNNTQSDKGILRFIGKNMPTDDGPLNQLKTLIVPQIINALIEKADNDYRGCAKIKSERDALEKAKDDLLKNFNQSNMNKVSDAFETLYARLRMQEAVKVRDYIKNNADFNALNEVKAGIINDDMVVAETYANLKEEGIANPPSVNNLDEIQTVSTVVVNEQGVVDKDKEYENNPQGLLDEYLAKDNKYLTKIEGTNIYQTKDIDGNGTGVRYFTVHDNKLIEVKKNADGAFETPANPPAVKSADIEEYDASVLRIKKLIKSKAIAPVQGVDGLFKATGANEYYALIGNKFGKVKGSVDGITIEELTTSDIEDFDDNDIKSAKKVADDKKSEESKKIQDKIDKITSERFYSLTAVQDKASELGYRKSVLDNYFVLDTPDGKKHFFRYENGQLVLQEGVSGIKANGQIKQNGVWTAAKTDLTPSDLGLELRRKLNGDTSSDDYNRIDKILNIFASYEKADDIIEFIEAYTKQMKEDEAIFRWNDRLCAQISTENNYGKERKAKALQIIAKQVKRVMEEYHIQLGGYGQTSEDYDDMRYYAENTTSDESTWQKDGAFWRSWSFWNSERTGAANNMDDIIDKLIEDYNEKVKGAAGKLDQET